MAQYFTFPAPSISSMTDESLSTEPPGSDQPLLISGPNTPDADNQSKDGDATVTVVPANEPEAGQQRRIGTTLDGNFFHSGPVRVVGALVNTTGVVQCVIGICCQKSFHSFAKHGSERLLCGCVSGSYYHDDQNVTGMGLSMDAPLYGSSSI